MCGIIGIVGTELVAMRLIEGLKRLEYRGYDSAGIAVLNGGGLERSRSKGKIKALEERLNQMPVDGLIGIAHTRWATHGAPTENNAHPHFSGNVGLVHNGIIENFTELRDELKKTRTFYTETDTEVVAHLIDEGLCAGKEPQQAFSDSLTRLTGAFALAVIIVGHEDKIFVARRGSPLAIGIGDGETYLGSDAIALASLSQKLIFLEEGDWAVLTHGGASIFDENNKAVTREIVKISSSLAAAEKGNYRHFMLKEIHEQPETIGHTLTHYVDVFNHKAKVIEGLDFSKIDCLNLIACGTAAYAGEVAKYWFEQLANLPTHVDIASEFRYRCPALSSNGMAMAISQSGETLDTLEALRYCQKKSLKVAALVNVLTSSMARESDVTIPINAGPEIGVASTKAFTAQLTSLLAMAISAGRQRGVLSEAKERDYIAAITHLPRLVIDTLILGPQIDAYAAELAKAKDVFYLGRGWHFPIALEGALKLKEISYIHAEGYAAGELKHGPIALIEEGTPVIVVAPYDRLFEKTISNMQEVASRGAKTFLITDEKGAKYAKDMANQVLVCPDSDSVVSPIVMTIVIQLIAYHTAVHLGTDVDQPRNLAKSVTVE
ncbi:MAG: glutamine--fructose-6-phosphate transaminase (isomerizing) [Robiginitomaculum sp.]